LWLNQRPAVDFSARASMVAMSCVFGGASRADATAEKLAIEPMNAAPESEKPGAVGDGSRQRKSCGEAVSQHGGGSSGDS